MKEISISVMYEEKDSLYNSPVLRISDARDNHVPPTLEIIEIHYEKEWLPGKTRITFKGVYK